MNTTIRVVRRLRRLLLVGMHVVWGLFLATSLLYGDPVHRSRRQWRMITGFMKRLCRILGLRVHAQNRPGGSPSLLVANHISWQDVVVFHSLVTTGFVAKHEIRGWPLIGWLAQRGNTLFIQRGRRDSTQQITRAMSLHMRAGQSIMIFPEGTTTDGTNVAVFRSRLFAPAIEVERMIQPVAIYYRSPDLPCAKLAFIGEESFVHHFLRLLGEPFIDVYVRFCDPIPVERSTDRRQLAEQAQHAVAEALENLKINHGAHGDAND